MKINETYDFILYFLCEKIFYCGFSKTFRLQIVCSKYVNFRSLIFNMRGLIFLLALSTVPVRRNVDREVIVKRKYHGNKTEVIAEEFRPVMSRDP